MLKPLNYVWSVLALDKGSKSSRFVKLRNKIQCIATLITNGHIFNFLKGTIYTGNLKKVCVPGLNCYSCPGATGACPIGAFQAVVGSSKFRFSYYISGILILLGVTFGRFICGFFCPFGWFQDLLHKLPTKKLSTKKLKPLTYIKYVILVLIVVILPSVTAHKFGISVPYFCKYICPQGILEGGIPLSLINISIKAALGILFQWKLIILITILVLSIYFYRPFCKWFCPLGAFYALFNKISLVNYTVDQNKCITCGKCKRVCKMDANICANKNMSECIRCGDCITACPTQAISITFIEKYQKKKELENENKNA